MAWRRWITGIWDNSGAMPVILTGFPAQTGENSGTADEKLWKKRGKNRCFRIDPALDRGCPKCYSVLSFNKRL